MQVFWAHNYKNTEIEAGAGAEWICLRLPEVRLRPPPLRALIESRPSTLRFKSPFSPINAKRTS